MIITSKFLDISGLLITGILQSVINGLSGPLWLILNIITEGDYSTCIKWRTRGDRLLNVRNRGALNNTIIIEVNIMIFINEIQTNCTDSNLSGGGSPLERLTRKGCDFGGLELFLQLYLSFKA
jgi:hypothetical protein